MGSILSGPRRRLCARPHSSASRASDGPTTPEALRAGLDPLVVARLAGHADPRTTMAYDRRGAEDDAAKARKIGRGRFE